MLSLPSSPLRSSLWQRCALARITQMQQRLKLEPNDGSFRTKINTGLDGRISPLPFVPS
jgi:hypothetical protein